MRTTKSLSLLFIVGLSNAALAYGCSSDPETTATEPEEAGRGGGIDAAREATSIILEDTGSPDVRDASSKDAKPGTKKDTSIEDAIADVVPDVVFDPPGAPCGPLFAKQERACGTCGTENRVCLKQLDAGAADAAGQPGYWSPWSNCATPPTAVCDPVQNYADEACGNCGTKQRVCQLDCTFIAGLTCQNEGQCAPGANDWEQGLGCNSPLGRNKSCTPTCSYDLAATCTTAPPNPNNLVIASTTPGTVVTKTFSMSAVTDKRIVGSFSGALACPATLSSTMTVRQYIEVKNTTAAALHLSVWTSKAATTAVSSDTIMAVYAGGNVPKTDAERQNCIELVSDDCDGTLGGALNPKGCVSSQAGLLKGDGDGSGGTYAGVPIPANGSITVYAAPYSGTTAGNIVVSVKVEGP